MWPMLIVLAQIAASQPGGQEDFELCKVNRPASLEEIRAACTRVTDNKVLDKASLAEAYASLPMMPCAQSAIWIRPSP